MQATQQTYPKNPWPRIRRVLYPFKPIRYLTTKGERRLTTVVGIRGKNGIVFLSDSQATVGETKESVSKLSTIGKDIIFGGAGYSNFIDDLKRFITSEVERDESLFINKLNLAIRDYRNFVDNMYKESPLYETLFAKAQVSALIGRRIRTEKSSFDFELYEINTPWTAQQIVGRSCRSAIGTGGQFVRLLFQSAEEYFLNLSQVHKNWSEFDVKFISQVCYFMVERVLRFDVNSSPPMETWILDDSEKGGRFVPESEVFPNRMREDNTFRYRSEMLLVSAVKELGMPTIKALLGRYKPSELFERLIREGIVTREQLVELMTDLLGLETQVR